jgi:hypothetical protein
MLKAKRTFVESRGVEPQPYIGVAGCPQNVVIAGYQLEADVCELVQQFAEFFPNPVVIAVEQISQNEHPLRPKADEQAAQPLEVSFRYGPGHGNARSAKMSPFAQMGIG